VDSDADMVALVARTRGAIGYVSADAGTDGVKTLTVTSGASNGQRKLLKRIEPEYPETLERLNIGGTVRLKVTISARGKVESVALIGGNPILGDAAAAAVRQWIYSPSNGSTDIEVTLSFGAHP
jgi:TonB family protein